MQEKQVRLMTKKNLSALHNLTCTLIARLPGDVQRSDTIECHVGYIFTVGIEVSFDVHVAAGTMV